MKCGVWVCFGNLWRICNFHYNLTNITGTLYEDRYTFLIISRSILHRMRNVSDKSCRENQSTHFVFSNFYPKIYLFRDNVVTYDITEQATYLLTYLFTYLLTHSTVQSLSWAANRFAASQEIPRISRNPNVHYRTHKRPPPVSILGQPNPVHIPTSHLLEIHP